MLVYRICDSKEFVKTFADRGFKNIGRRFKQDSTKSNHKYLPDTEYIHFFEKLTDVVVLPALRMGFLFIFDIPEDILETCVGEAYYYDLRTNKRNIKIVEYAIPIDMLKFKYLKKVYKIEQSLYFEDIPTDDDVYARLEPFYNMEELNAKLKAILTGKDVTENIKTNIDDILFLIPEIRHMMGFEHKHPHHHLNVFDHTLLVIQNLESTDFVLNLAALLHDIGKPFSYQEGIVRHFYEHSQVSCQMSTKILERLDLDENTVAQVLYLIRTHDTLINTNNLDNSIEMVQKRLKLQYADARAHHPSKVEKRIKTLDVVSNNLKNSLNNT